MSKLRLKYLSCMVLLLVLLPLTGALWAKNPKKAGDSSGGDNGSVVAKAGGASAPTAESALAKAKKEGEGAHKEYLNANQQDLAEIKRDFEHILAKLQEILGHGANAHAGAKYEAALAETAKHPAHKDHPDVKKAGSAVVAAQKSSEAVAQKALDQVNAIKGSASQLAKTADDGAQKIAEQTGAIAKPNTSSAMGMAVALTKSNVDQEANAKLADINGPAGAADNALLNLDDALLSD